jgi:hypothetical protein
MERGPVQDAVLGSLDWDDDCWLGHLEIRPGATISLIIAAEDEEIPTERLLGQARQWSLRLRAEEAGFRRLAASSLIDRYNRSFSEGQWMEAEELARRIRPTSLLVFDSGNAEVCYDDDDLFAGRTISLWCRDDGSVRVDLLS